MPTPVVAMSRPAIAGPKMREALKRLELSAMALGSSGLPDHLDGEGLANRRVEDEHRAARGGEEEHLPDLGAVGEREARERSGDGHAAPPG